MIDFGGGNQSVARRPRRSSGTVVSSIKRQKFDFKKSNLKEIKETN
jgi:hypothetical protein